jgi:hypothetical protein
LRPSQEKQHLWILATKGKEDRGDLTHTDPNVVDATAGRTGKEETKMAELQAKGVCDFCGEACNADMRGAKAYDCADFEMPMTGAMSHGAWGACSGCAALIDSEGWDSLKERMTETHSRRFGLVAEVLLPMLRQMYAQQIQLFRQHRIVAVAAEAGLHGTFGQGGEN